MFLKINILGSFLFPLVNALTSTLLINWDCAVVLELGVEVSGVTITRPAVVGKMLDPSPDQLCTVTKWDPDIK